jgi:hypothetical protein
VKMRAWTELVLAILAGTVGLITAVLPTWFEALFEVSPDEGSGAFEVAIAITLIVTSIGLAFLAGRDSWRVVGSEA